MKCDKGECNKEATCVFVQSTWDLRLNLCEEHWLLVIEEYDKIMREEE